MGLSSFVSGGSSIKGDTIVEAIYNSVILISELETRSNKDNTQAQTNFVSWAIAGDATKTFTATLAIPARMVKDVTTGKIRLTPRNFISDYITWEAGTGDLATAPNLPEALIDLCDNATYLERQIDPNIVIQTPNQVQITPDQEAGVFNIQIVLPAIVKVDPTTGKPDYVMFDYLYVLDGQPV